MRAFFITVMLMSLLAGIFMCYAFNYPASLAIYHVATVGIICFIAILFLFTLRLIIRNERSAYFISNAIALPGWIFLCFFYPIILGSNFLWGATITFDILYKYLVSLDAALSVIPVQKWILIAGLILYTGIIVTAFYFIRIRRSFFRKKPVRGYLDSGKHLSIVFAALIILVFVFRAPIMKFKRTIHFKKEPLIYFALGPMWGVNWSDEAMFNNKPLHSSAEEQNCITEVKPDTAAKRAVVIILLDALRADHLSVYGYSRKTTPFLDSLYGTNTLIRVDNFYSTSTNTSGGIASLFYSKDWGNFGYQDLTLMKYFKRSGYSTSAILTGYHSGWYGLSTLYRQDCDMFFESTADYKTVTDDDLVTLQKIESVNFTDRSFTFIHLLSTHGIGKKNEQFRVYQPYKLGLNSKKAEVLTNNYDNGVLQGDFVIRKIFEKLKKDGVLDNAIVMITGDHGELLGEHGEFGHGKNIEPKVLEVPLLIYDKDTSWYKNKRIATIKDIAPTITDRLFGKRPICWQGRSMHDTLSSFSTRLVSPIRYALPEGELLYRNDSLLMRVFNGKLELVETLYKDTVWKRQP